MNTPDTKQLLLKLAEDIKPHIRPDTALVGIHTGGAWLAGKLHEMLGVKTPLGTLDISFYRDDFQKIGLHPEVKPSEIPFDVNDREIVLVDDVLYTGRTARAAINVLFDYGRPASIKLAVLIDREGRELPIEAQYVGAQMKLGKNRMIELSQDGKLMLTSR